jgi:hypothetical protein
MVLGDALTLTMLVQITFKRQHASSVQKKLLYCCYSTGPLPPSNLFNVLSQHILELITQDQEYLHLQDLLQESSQQLNNHQKLLPRHKVKQEQWQTNSPQ